MTTFQDPPLQSRRTVRQDERGPDACCCRPDDRTDPDPGGSVGTS